ncbi:MAG: polyhydroxyalkanoic acid synthase [Comamonadaceae bacterium]|nr:MAG: polyhydroxyalkanoic acid synthase [Comamonadaceae bacterium]
MPDIHIERSHSLGLARAREAARNWIEQAEREYGVDVRYDEGPQGDVATFERAGVEGRLEVGADRLEVRMAFGFLMDAFSGPIEAKLRRSIDRLIGEPAAGA